MRRGSAWAVAVAIVAGATWSGCDRQPAPGTVLDEARRAGRAPASMPAADEDYFHDMDGGVRLTADEAKGRNTWIVWTGGNDRFWDRISFQSFGALDFLKTLSSHPGLKYGRDDRWHYLGLVNEPCFEKATGPDPDRFGLWLDHRRADCPPDPFENAAKYPGMAIGARGKTVPVGSYYGYATGIVGLRLFPNPDFDAAAQKKWDPERYYTDPAYYYSKDLVKPYRVGMSCGFCHVGPDPTRPPADPEHPEWKNLNSSVGAQYFWVDRIFMWSGDQSSFAYQIFHTSRPGALDTSFVSTDYINNPRTMNAVYDLFPRLMQGKRWGKETLAGGGLDNRQFNDFVSSGPLTELYAKPATVWTPHVLKDGADSVGALGALNRVFLNIGLFSEEWLLHFNALVGGKRTSPIPIAVARENSAYWQATEAQTPDLALFFLKAATPHRLKDAPGGKAYLTADRATLTRGKEVFAERCARCHSSKLPADAPGLDAGAGCAGAGYLDCWNRYWAWTRTDDFKRQMRKIVLADDFLDGNFLSTDARVPVTLLQTNACSPLATNAIGNNIWDNFSSQTYKDLPSVGKITVYDPFTGEPREYQMPAGGRGYTRPPTLVSLWSTAPYLLNNTLGRFDPSPSVEARMRSFDDAVEKLLWPEKRERDRIFAAPGPGTGIIDRTTTQSFLRVPAGYLSDNLRPLRGFLQRTAPWAFADNGDVQLGPIPAGTPVNLVSNIEIVSEDGDVAARLDHDRRVAKLLIQAKHALAKLPKGATDDQARAAFAGLVDPMLALSKCPDFVVNRGHYFGTDWFADEPGLSDGDKRALIAFLKTF
jgi:hypothetical protein